MKKHTISALTSLLLAAAPCTSLIFFPVDSHAATLTTSSLKPEWRLAPRDKLYSANSEFYLTLLNDCNLHVIRTRDQKVIWASHTAGFGTPKFALMQSDGNFVLYTHNKGAVWATSRFGSGRDIIMQNDGNLVVYGKNNKPLWASNSLASVNPLNFTSQQNKSFSRIQMINRYNGLNSSSPKKVTYLRYTDRAGNRPWGAPTTRRVQVVAGVVAVAEVLAETVAEIEAFEALGTGVAEGIADGTAFDAATAEAAEATTLTEENTLTFDEARAAFEDTADPCGRRLGTDGRRLGDCLPSVKEKFPNDQLTAEYRQVTGPNGQRARIPYVRIEPGTPGLPTYYELPYSAQFSEEATVYRTDVTRSSSNVFQYGFRAQGDNFTDLGRVVLEPEQSGYVPTTKNPGWIGRIRGNIGGDVGYYTIDIPENTGLDFNATLEFRGEYAPTKSSQQVGIPGRIPREWVRSYTDTAGRVTRNPYYSSPWSAPRK